MDKWRPIETVPKKNVLLYYPPIVNSRGTKTHGEWITIGINSAPRKATHWMPLPNPPEGTNG